MLNPFMFLPIVGALTLIKATLHSSAIGIVTAVSTLIMFIIYSVIYWFHTDVKPLRPARRNMEFWGVDNIRDLLPPLVEEFADADADADHAHMIFDFFEIPVPAGPIITQNDNNTDVHNHQIQESLRTGIRALTEWYEGLDRRKSQVDTYKEIKEYLFSDYKDRLDKKEKAYSTIRHIEKTNGLLASVDKREGEILQMVWQRINDPINEKVRSELRDNLLDLLSDSAIRIDASYCLIGRVTRMVQSLQSLDQEGLVDIKSMGILAKEIQAKVPILRDNFFADHPSLLARYENGDNMAAKQLIEFVKEVLYRDYPQANTDAKLQSVITEHLDVLN